MSVQGLAQSRPSSSRSGNWPDSISAMRADEPRFFGAGVVLFVMLVPTILAMAIDDRIFNGINVWDKPLKFEIALIVYLLTLAYFARWLPGGMLKSRLYRVFSWVVVSSVALEMIWIAGAAANGTGSHFNVSTPFMAAVYPLMGLLAVTLTSASMVYAIAIHRNRAAGLDPAFRLSLVLGLGMTFVLTVVVAGTMSGMPGHWVGGSPTDSNGLALMGWARDGGDLRVAHFFATHCLHLVPLAGYAASRHLGSIAAMRAVVAAAIVVGSLVLFSYVQALLGMPFLPVIGGLNG